MKLSAPVYQLKRRAKLLARKEKLPLHDALDRIAHEEGLARWSLLSSRLKRGPGALLHRLSYGDLLLLAGRPGHGKTLLGLQLLLDAVDESRKATFFTLEYTEREAMQRIRSLRGAQGMDERLEIVTSDDLSADFVVDHLSGSDQGTVAVLDYLQVLDQQRSKPPLADQMRVFRDFA
jgi:predicted ATP-dependent serine protease